ncbi:NIPSNAP family containing protein [Steroidobacter agaridevorans]|uniref:NIPSNAP family containing protein n=1 Tax=Steroidobacter agaridevorans TaxID=2695856 RepID=A0A829YFF0_9GAMM|nr:NIPSNAP family protein [Steroidobacter agaridevorans]GFE81578.1 NIPSNAP family containing protein [Steroidobacter agaridevorans]
MRTLLAALLAIFTMTTHADSTVTTPTVLELRQYKIFADKRDEMIAVFDGKLIEGQEAVGMRLLGQFRDLDDPNRFTWMREFPNMDARGKALTDFYTGPVWKAHRGEANPLLEDNDNVLLLKPATAELALSVPAASERTKSGDQPTAANIIVVTIYYLWKDPSEGFTRFFAEKLKPELTAAGVPVLGGYVTEATPNNFPALPVRQHEKVFVWFTRMQDAAGYDPLRRKLDGSAIGRELEDYQERAPQVLRLAPTPRSLLR